MPSTRILDQMAGRERRVPEQRPGEGHARPAQHGRRAEPRRAALAHEILDQEREVGDLHHCRVVRARAHQIAALHRPPARRAARHQLREPVAFQLAIGIEHDHAIRRVLPGQPVAPESQRMAFAAQACVVPLDDANAQARAGRARDVRGVVGAIVGDHHQPHGLAKPGRQRRDEARDAGPFIMGRHENDGADRWRRRDAGLAAGTERADQQLGQNDEQQQCRRQSDAPGDDAQHGRRLRRGPPGHVRRGGAARQDGSARPAGPGPGCP